MREILPTKRFDKNFKEVVKPTPVDYIHSNGSEQLEVYSQAQQRKVLVPLSEFVYHLDESLSKESQQYDEPLEWHNEKFYQMICKYANHITQPITEKSLEGVECVIGKDCSIWFTNSKIYLQKYKTIEHAINDGVLFILKQEL